MSDTRNSGIQKLSNSEAINPDMENDEENFFDQTIQKKRSFTDD